MEFVRIFSVSMPRAGHHVAEMVLRGLLGQAFAYCEYYTVQDCCKSIPCARISAHQSQGTKVFMQKSHDHQLADPVPAAMDGILIQVREPIARALSNYELDLATVGAPHTESYLKFWLGKEAAYANAFFRKWRPGADKRFLVMRYEDLLGDPVAYFRRIFETFKVPMRYFDAEAVARMQGASSAGGFAFKQRDPTRSRYFTKDIFDAYATVIAEAASLVGYDALLGAELQRRDPSLEACFRAFTALLAGELREALAALNEYLELPDAHYSARQQRALVLSRLGSKATAEAELIEVLEIAPDFVSASIDLASLQDERGDLPAAHETLMAAMRVSATPEKVYERMLHAFTRSTKRQHLIPSNSRPPSMPADGRLSREDVVSAFRWILGREPESEAVIENHRMPSVEALRTVLLSSEEFNLKHQKN